MQNRFENKQVQQNTENKTQKPSIAVRSLFNRKIDHVDQIDETEHIPNAN